jgi:hypothetical protein
MVASSRSLNTIIEKFHIFLVFDILYLNKTKSILFDNFSRQPALGARLGLGGTILTDDVVGVLDFLLVTLNAANQNNISLRARDPIKCEKVESVPSAQHRSSLVLSVLFLPLDNVSALLAEANVGDRLDLGGLR